MVLVNERAEARGNEFSGETEVEQERLREKAGSNISKVYGGAGVYRKGADVYRQGVVVELVSTLTYYSANLKDS